MKQTTINLPEDLARAVERYREDLKEPPALADVVQTALRRYLEERGYLAGEATEWDDLDGEDEIIMPEPGVKPRGLPDGLAPRPKGGGNPVSDAVIEDRR
jgi:Arc/MetJ-type ribon-helix-helix transcriptional regulator